MLIVNNENFKSEVQEAKGLVLIDFFASWCGPCRMISPILEELSKEISDVKFCKVDVDESTELAMAFGVSSIPTLIVFENGKVKDTAVGLRPKDAILDMLN